MRYRIMFLCLLAVLPSVAWSSCAKYPKTGKALVEIERAWVSAYDTRDLATMSCLLAPEYRHTAYDGKVMNRAEALARLAGESKEGATRHEVHDLKASLFGDVAVVYGDNHVFDPDGRMLGVMRFTDVFVYRDGRWVAVAEHESRVQASAK